jgi:hypothetical protein
MVLSVSVVLLLAVTVAVLCRWAGLRAWHAMVCALLGFYLASSPLAPTIAAAVQQLADLVAGR